MKYIINNNSFNNNAVAEAAKNLNGNAFKVWTYLMTSTAKEFNDYSIIMDVLKVDKTTVSKALKELYDGGYLIKRGEISEIFAKPCENYADTLSQLLESEERRCFRLNYRPWKGREVDYEGDYYEKQELTFRELCNGLWSDWSDLFDVDFCRAHPNTEENVKKMAKYYWDKSGTWIQQKDKA